MIHPNECLAALFSSREGYFKRTLQAHNCLRAFPLAAVCPPEEYLRRLGCSSLFLSGGTQEERAAFLAYALRQPAKMVRCVILHDGNCWLTPQALARSGLPAVTWNCDPLAGMSPGQQLAVLTENGQDGTMAAFWALALDICRALGQSPTLAALAEMDWLGGGWQLRLLQTAPHDTAVDLLRRYDTGMAACAARAAARLEMLCRAGGGETTSCLPAKPGVVQVAEVRGGSAVLAKHWLDVLLDAVERGEELVLAVEGLDVRHPLLERPVPGVRLLRSTPDLAALPGGLESLFCQDCGIMLLRHTVYGSAQRLSDHFFGTYERLVDNSSMGVQQAFAGSLSKVRNWGVNMHRQRELRLPPRVLTMLPAGTACASLPDGWEGVVQQTRR